MHPFHDYVARQLADKLMSRRIVVWYDEHAEFEQFIEEVRSDRPKITGPEEVSIEGMNVLLFEYSGSMFELRTLLEPRLVDDAVITAILYLPKVVRDRHASVLMELEKAGTTWEPQLKQLARNVLLRKYTLGVVDEMLPFDRRVSYGEVARALAATSEVDFPSMLKSIFVGKSGGDELLAAWLVSDARDSEITSKEATQELIKLVTARIGLALRADMSLAKLRAITLRYILAGEFRLGLTADAPASLDNVGMPATKDAESAVCSLARRFRTEFPNEYMTAADRVEQELGLNNSKLHATAFETIDTFRFQERILLQHAGDLISCGDFVQAQALVTDWGQSFWLQREVSRKAQWEAARRMAELGNRALKVRKAVDKIAGDAAAWLDAYVSEDGWFHLDQAQRRLEEWVANLDEEPDERPLGLVRRLHEDTCQAMAEGFTKALTNSGWTIPGAFHQTRIWNDIVTGRPRPVAYFLVDAMRFEMGAELAERLPKTSEISLRHAVSALPSITPIGMAALMPGASGSFSVIEQGGRLGALIDGSFLPDVVSRKKFFSSRVPKLVDLTLDEVLSISASRLSKRVDGAQVIVVRSQEVDHAGETGFTFQARQVMDTVIDNIARAIRKLASAGIEYAIVTADHGHLFFANERNESMRTTAPGGDTVELHRRCWIGRGGTTPPGCVRVPAVSLGYESNLDFVFAPSIGVFRAGGDLSYHHGGPTLQEIVIPVLTIRTKARRPAPEQTSPITADRLPDAITNRIFSVTFHRGAEATMFDASSIQLRPLLMAAGKQVGAVGMAAGAEFDRATGCVTLQANSFVTVAFLLSDESVDSLRVVVQEPTTDAELYRSPTEIPVRLGV